MGGTPFQTPTTYLLKGGAGFFSKACIKALANCGYTPEMFGSYSYVDKQIKAGRAGGISGMPQDCQDFVGGSQSGHIAMNANFQGAGGRGDPCTNVLAGYTMEGAPCMPHHGKSNVLGDTHQVITANERSCARNLGLPVGSPMTEAQVTACARATVATAVSGSGTTDIAGNRGRTPAELDRRAADAAKEDKRVRKAEGLGKKDRSPASDAARRRAGEARSEAAQRRSSSAASSAAGVGPGSAPAAKGRKTTPKDEKKAIDCIMAFWRAGMDEMRRRNAAENSSAAKLAGAGKGTPSKKAVAAREKAVADKVKKGKATAEECLEHQANATNRYMSANGGRLPPLSGRVP